MNCPDHGEETAEYVVPLSDVDPENRTAFGGKGANLGALVTAGFDVPDGFCVTTDAYESLLSDEIRDAIRSLDDVDDDHAELERRAAGIRESVRTLEAPAALREGVREAVRSLGADSYAVRSSATAEDLPTASFAGQHETYPGVDPDDVLDRVLNCVASLFTDRAVAYRTRNGVPHADVALAVVVQGMVGAEAAGVLFTADPDSGNRTVASVDAAYGLGDSVVAGDVDPDNARVRKSTGEILSYDVGAKAERLALDDGGTSREAVPDDARAERVLTDGRLRDLVRLGVRIEAYFGSPQDIEWALVDGEFVVLQSRPITSLFPLPEPLPSDDRLHVYLSMGHAQAIAEAMPPLAVDLWVAIVEEMFADFEAAEGSAPWAAHAGGRVYEDVTPLVRHPLVRDAVVDGLASFVEDAALGLDDLLDRRPEEFGGGVRPSGLPFPLRDTWRVARGLAPVVPSIVSGFLLAFVRAGDDAASLRAWYRSWGAEIGGAVLDSDDPAEGARSAFEGIPFDTIELMRTVYPKVMPLFAGMAADRALRGLFPDEGDAIDAAGRGASDEVGIRMNLLLDDLEAVAREHPAVEEAILDERPVERIGDVEGGDAFRERFEAFLAEFGHRTTSEIDVSRPRWRDDPAGVLAVVRGNLRGGSGRSYRDRLRERQREAQEAVDRLQEEAGRGVLGPLRLRLVRRLLRVYRGYLPLRDEPKHGSAHLFAAWHEGLQRAGDRLAADGVLADADDVWYLERAELFDLLDGDDADLPDVEARRREHERFARLDAPAMLTSEGEALSAPGGRDLGDDVLAGTGVSSGVVEGTARVVRDPRETVLEAGEILVAPSCDPGWTPLFRNAGGLVAEVGGRMTHGALVAREYGLPAVMSVPGATKRIETGRRIRVDGNRGTVEPLE